MLPKAHRLRSSAGFARAIRWGATRGRPAVVVHALATQTDAPGQVGFVVGRRVAGAVGRNRVRRRLRHLAAAHVDDLSAGMIVVVRATASAVDDAALADDFETSWSAALRAATRREAEAPMVAVAGDRRLTSDLVGYVETVRVAA